MASSAQKAVLAKDQGNALFSEGRFEEAFLRYKEAISLDKTQVVFHSNAAQCLLNLKKYSEALDLANSALQLDKNHVKSLVRRASALRGLSRASEAADDLKTASKLEPTNKSIATELSSLLKALNISQEASTSTTSSPTQGSSATSNSKKIVSSAIAEAQQTLENLIPDVPEPAQSFGDFEVHWRPLRKYPELMHQYLLQFDPNRLPSLFKDLMTTEMLQSWLETVLQMVQSPTSPAPTKAVAFLEKLASLPRFDLMIMFLTPSQQSLVSSVFAALEEKKVDSGALKSKFL